LTERAKTFTSELKPGGALASREPSEINMFRWIIDADNGDQVVSVIVLLVWARLTSREVGNISVRPRPIRPRIV
jgi:hypothetical protein